MKTPTSLTKLSAIAALAIILSTVNAVAATFTVTNAKDSGAGSLRQAVLDANAAASADRIVFDATFFGTARTITLATEITANPETTVDSLTITGPGANLLTIKAGGSNQIFVNSTNNPNTDTLSLSGMTITGSSAGAITNFATLTVTDCVFSSNITFRIGGAISNAIASSILTVSNSVFNGNASAAGGAIYGDGMITVTNSTFNSNTAGDGGAIASGGSLTVTNCAFTNNAVTSNSATGLGGGAIYSSSNLTAAVVTITNSTFTGNAEGGRCGGGGVVRNRSGAMIITNSIFTNNTAVAGRRRD